MEEVSGSPVQSSAGTPGGYAMSTPPATLARINAFRGTASPVASIKSSPSVSKENEADNSPSLELGQLMALCDIGKKPWKYTRWVFGSNIVSFDFAE